MKKLIAMIGAVATAFGLYAADPYKISFESADSSLGVDTSAMTFTTQTPWSPVDTVLTLVASDATAQNTAYGSGEFARRSFNGPDQNFDLKIKSQEVTLAAAEGDVFLDQLVKFTGFDEAPEIASDAKIAIWMSEMEDADDDSIMHTNLYITAAGSDEAFQIGDEGDFELDKWYRVTVRNIGNIYKQASSLTARAGFIVYVNGQLVSSATEPDLPATEMTAKAAAYMAQRQLFASLVEGDTAFNSVTYKGIGEVDDIIVDAEGPAFAQEVTFTLVNKDNRLTYKVFGNEEEVPELDGAYTVKKGTAVTVQAIALPGYFVDPTEPVDVKELGSTVDVSAMFETTAATVKVSVDGVEDYYDTMLSGAIAYAEKAEGDEIIVTALDDDLSATVDGTFEIALPNEETITVDATTKAWDVSAASLSGAITGRSIEIASLTLANDLVLGGGTTLNNTFYIQNNPLEYTITLNGSATLITTTELTIDEQILSGDQTKVVNVAFDETDEVYTYTLKDPAPAIEYVTFTVAKDAGVASYQVFTNDAVEVTGTENSFTVESNAVVKITAEAATGYDNIAITRKDDGEIAAGVFTADVDADEITISATLKKFDVKFFKDEGKTEQIGTTVQVNYGEKAEAPAAPTKDGYTFTDWNPSTNDAITAATDFVAQWAINQYTVTFDSKGGSAVASQTVDYNQTATKPNDPTKTDYEFKGWFTDDGIFAEEFDFNTAITADTTLFAKWDSAAKPAPDEPKPYPSAKDAEEAAAAFNDADNDTKATMMAIPAAAEADAAAYAGLFEAVQGGAENKEVTFVLSETGKTAIETAIEATETSILTTADGGTAKITGKPGIYYGLKAQANLEGIAAADATQWQQAPANGEVSFTITKPSTDKGFYQVQYSASEQK